MVAQPTIDTGSLNQLAQARKRKWREHATSPPPGCPGERRLAMRSCFEDSCLLDQMLVQVNSLSIARPPWFSRLIIRCAAADWRSRALEIHGSVY